MNKKGFTLVELLVVIAIIGVLSSVVFAALSTSRAKARAASAQQAMSALNAALKICLDSSSDLNFPTETQDGGAGQICPGSSANYGKLPTGWYYCNNGATAQGTADCGNDITQKTVAGGFLTDYSVVIESNPDTTKITCTPSGCTKATDND